jgi:hypothetical protein
MKMSVSKMAAWLFCAASGFFLLLTMVVSTAGLREETRTIFIITLVLAGLSFCMVQVDRVLEEDRQTNAPPQESSSLMQQAVTAMERWEASDSPEDWAAFQKKAAEALLSLGDVSLSPRNQAIGAISEAIDARRTADEEPDDDLRAGLMRTAEHRALHAFRLFRKAL